MKECIFKEIIQPILPAIEEEAHKIKADSDMYTLSFFPFTINLLFSIIEGIKSISQLVTFIKTSQKAKELKLVHASKSMYSEAFDRYPVSAFRRIFSHVLSTMRFIEIPELKSLGCFYLSDGSVFPALKTMAWATYKKSINAIKLHLCFELNRMIPVSFLSTEANYSEKKALLCLLSQGITFIADRGYFKFKLFKQIVDKGAHFIIRGKNNMLFHIIKTLSVSLPKGFSSMVSNVTDLKVLFTNDPNNVHYRVVSFWVMDEHYNLVTDRFDLTTYQVIMLYAYRWQVELVFRFLKRTLNGIHLMNHTPEGVEIQFLLYMIAYLLLLHTKQKCNEIVKAASTDHDTLVSVHEVSHEKNKTSRSARYAFVTMLGRRLHKYWRISIHWLITLRNLLLAPLTFEHIKILAL
jgi:hypothetical protein